jgi:hypothetical protein
MKRRELTSRAVAAVIVIGLASLSGCTADLRDVYKAVKQIEPDAKKRNQEIRELTGVPEEESK